MRRAIRGIVAAAVIVTGCGLSERDDFLLGRPCAFGESECEAEDRCLPHSRRAEGTFDEYFCRSEASFDSAFAPEPLPLAYCDPDRGIECPGAVPCEPDRVRVDVGPRPLVCAVE